MLASSHMMTKLIKDTAIYGLTDFIFKLINFAIFPVFTYALSVQEFGSLSLLSTLATLAALFLNCGMDSAMQMHFLEAGSEYKRKIIVSTALACVIIFSFAGTIFFLGILSFWKNHLSETLHLKWTWVVVSLLGNIGLQLMQLCLNIARITFKAWNFFLLSFLQNGLLIVFTVGFAAYLKWGVGGFVCGTLLANLLVLPLGLFTIRHNFAWGFDKRAALSMAAFGYPLIFTGLAYWIFGSMDRWMLGEMSNNTQVGLYSIAFKLASVMIFLVSAFGAAWTPHALNQRAIDLNYRQFFSQCLTLWFFLLTIASCILGLFGQEVLYFLTPRAYWEAANTLPYLTAGLTLYGTTQITAIGISIHKKNHLLMAASWTAAIANFLLNLALIPTYGAQGAAIATMASYFILTVFYLICSQNLHPIPLEKNKLGLISIVLMAALGLSLWMNTLPVSIGFIIIKAIFIIIIIILGFTLRIIDVNNIKNVSKAAKPGDVS